MRVVYAKLINNEEIFAYLVGMSNDSYIFRDCMILEERMNSASGSLVTVLIDYFKYVDTESKNKDIHIEKSHVIFCKEVSHEYERYYKISRIYYDKYVEPNSHNEVKKVTDAMEEVLYSPPTKPAASELKSTANNTLH